jgi:hypothetical protein
MGGEKRERTVRHQTGRYTGHCGVYRLEYRVPYVSGIWSDEYEAGEFKKDQFVITDGDKISITVDVAEKRVSVKNDMIEVILKGNKLSIKNGSKSLFSLFDTHFQNIIVMKTVVSPARHVLSPDSIRLCRIERIWRRYWRHSRALQDTPFATKLKAIFDAMIVR